MAFSLQSNLLAYNQDCQLLSSALGGGLVSILNQLDLDSFGLYTYYMDFSQGEKNLFSTNVVNYKVSARTLLLKVN